MEEKEINGSEQRLTWKHSKWVFGMFAAFLSKKKVN